MKAIEVFYRGPLFPDVQLEVFRSKRLGKNITVRGMGLWMSLTPEQADSLRDGLLKVRPLEGKESV